MSDVHLDGIDQDEADAQRLARGLRRLRELRGFYDQMAGDLTAATTAGDQRIAALQAEIDAENAKLVEQVTEAALEFNAARDELVQTGFATATALNGKGLGKISIPKTARDNT